MTCRKLRGKFGDQKMTDLPKERCCEAAPVTHCGVDVWAIHHQRDTVPFSPALQVEQ